VCIQAGRGEGSVTRDPRAVAHLFSAASVTNWFSYFAEILPDDRVIHLGEQPHVAPDLIESIVNGGDRAVFFSSHETLIRDLDLARRLRAAGCPALAQSGLCARLGWDKFKMKRFFDASAVVTSPWGAGRAASALTGPFVVVKKRYGTQNVGTRLAQAQDCQLAPDEFAETFIPGVEYSVVVYRDSRGTATFPPVWKGPVSTDLVPPWRRLRLCPAPEIDAELDVRLRAIAVRIADAADAQGHLEVELLVDDDAKIFTLEINPRVSGTMRISAMATGVPIFSMFRHDDLRGALAAMRVAAEVPYSGPAICDPEGAVFGTSRLTVAGEDMAGVRVKIGRHVDPRREPDVLAGFAH
jgi:hypothetical protein